MNIEYVYIIYNTQEGLQFLAENPGHKVSKNFFHENDGRYGKWIEKYVWKVNGETAQQTISEVGDHGFRHMQKSRQYILDAAIPYGSTRIAVETKKRKQQEIIRRIEEKS